MELGNRLLNSYPITIINQSLTGILDTK